MTRYFLSYLITLLFFINIFTAAQTGGKLRIYENQNQTITFSGINWIVRNGAGNPGPNYWSDNMNNAWVDTNGYLHLKITNVNNTWYCPEIYSENYMSYGEYIFYIGSDLTKFDVNAVVGLFLYQDDNHEIDIEFSRWGNILNNPGWYSVQPVTNGTQASFQLSAGDTLTTHKIKWTYQNINFQSYAGNFLTKDSSNSVLDDWTYSGLQNPVPDSTRLHINFWLIKGNAPSDKQEMELIVKAVKINSITNVFRNGKSLPSYYNLEQNFPNPFNPSTTIKFSVPETSFVTIKIYDVLGRVIKTLVSEEIFPGSYKINFNAANLNSGIYLCRMQSEKFFKTTKLIFIK